VPGISAKHAKRSAKQNKSLMNLSKNGLVEAGGARYFLKNGKRLKKAWKTVSGNRYYFKGNGQAATRPTKVKGTWYVFSKQGKLMRLKKTGEVKAAGTVYRVSKGGRALAGLDKHSGRYYFANGSLLKGIKFHQGHFYAANAKGVYDSALTGQLRKAAKRGAKASELRALLGKPKSTSYVPSCNEKLGNGQDGVWRYRGFTVNTFVPQGSAVGSDAETIWSVFAE
jgi:hypothetical protein